MLLFWRQGFERTSLSDLTQAMGIRPASFYAAFNSKESLFREALQRYRSGVGSGLPRLLSGAATGREAMRLVLEGTAFATTQRARPRGCMIVLGALHGFTETASLGRELQRCRKADQGMIEARLRQARDDGELDSGCDVGELAAFFMAILQGMSIQARDGASRAKLMTLARLAMNAWPAAEATAARQLRLDKVGDRP